MGTYSRLLPEQGLDAGNTMNVLKFDNVCLKFPDGLFSGDEVRLLEVLNTRFEDLHEAFLQYDVTTNNLKRYQMPKTGDALVLLLIFGIDLFTTIRKHTNEKEKYYKSLRGSNLIIEISE